MKLVAAKCPSCGANINVDKNSKSIKCEYCNSRILVDDAIAKFKIEVSGEVEIKNIPKLENYMKLGKRNYDDKEYKEAFNYYSKALELDPDNYLAILRKGICKTYSTDYLKFEIKHALDGIKNTHKILENNNQMNEINQSIIEVTQAINWLVNLVYNYYNSKSSFDITAINGINSRLITCIAAFEYLYTISEDKRTKKIVLTFLVSTLDFLLQGKRCSKIARNNKIIIVNENLRPINNYLAYKDKREKYLCELDSDYAKKKEEENIKREKELQKLKEKKVEKEKKAEENLKAKFIPIDIFSYLGVLFCFMMAFVSATYGAFLSLFIWLFGIIIFIPYVRNKIVSKNGDYSLLVIFVRVFVFIAGIVTLGMIDPSVEGEYISKTDVELIVSERDILIKDSEGNEKSGKYERQRVDVQDANIEYYYEFNVITIDGEKILLRYIYYQNNERGFCLIENDECSLYFQPKEETNIKYRS